MASLEERRGGGNKKDLLKRDREKWGGGGLGEMGGLGLGDLRRFFLRRSGGH